MSLPGLYMWGYGSGQHFLGVDLSSMTAHDLTHHLI